MFGKKVAEEQFLELPDSLIQMETYSNTTDTFTVSAVSFTLNRDLKLI
jgi:hypothetical protein